MPESEQKILINEVTANMVFLNTVSISISCKQADFKDNIDLIFKKIFEIPEKFSQSNERFTKEQLR